MQRSILLETKIHKYLQNKNNLMRISKYKRSFLCYLLGSQSVMSLHALM